MCGIFGFWRQRGFDSGDFQRLRIMGDSLVHRGPDDFGYLRLATDSGIHLLDDVHTDNPQNYDLFLGSRRLSIVDPSSNGHQPMHDPTNNVFLVYNGEIYNHSELRSQLEALGHTFKSRSDTEVLLNAYLQWGDACVNKLIGMWAFLIWDQRSRVLLYARDRFGIKPLFVCHQNGVVYFSSECRAIRNILPTPPSINSHTMANFIVTSNLQSDSHGFYEAIDHVEPATLTRITPDKSDTQAYWTYSDQSQQYDFANPDHQFLDLLSYSVNRSFQADRDVGILLSGGIDSTSIASLAADGTAKCKHAFTSAFSEQVDLDELEYAKLMSDRCGYELHVSAYKAENFIADLYTVTNAFDAPLPSGQVLARYELLQLASQFVSVVTEGQGADEALGGYFSVCFRPYVKDELNTLTAGGGFQSLSRIVQALRTASQGHSRLFPLGAMHLGKHRALRDGFQLAPRLKVLSKDMYDRFSQSNTTPRDGCEISGHLNRLLLNQHKTQVLPRLLTYGDQISMAHSIESRVPFLDHRLVEFLFTLPYREKINGSYSKAILRRCMKNRIPDCILRNTRKLGFDTPIENWMTRNSAEIQSVFGRQSAVERGLFDQRYLKRLVKNLPHLNNRDTNLLFRCLALEIWSEQQAG